jgi:cytochrome P450
MFDRSSRFPVGTEVTLDELEGDFHGVLRRLREREPVSWLPSLDAWMVTDRATSLRVLRDATTFTVDDPRFSTAQVLGPSMLSLDGDEHARHREPFADPFRLAEVQRRVDVVVAALAGDLVASLRPSGRAELRRDLAGPLAVRVMTLALELVDTDPDTLLGWYDDIVAAVTEASSGPLRQARVPDGVGQLADRVRATVASGEGVLAGAARSLSLDEIVSNTGVMLFGGIETSEGMTANALAHLLTERDAWATVAADRSWTANAIEESLRLEPAVVRVDRFATRSVELGAASIDRGELVIVSLAGANRDPSVFAEPDRFDVHRPNAKQHLTFVHGPHACPGMHLARLATRHAVGAVLDALPDVALDPSAALPQPAGTVFRKPDRVDVVWTDR